MELLRGQMRDKQSFNYLLLDDAVLARGLLKPFLNLAGKFSEVFAPVLVNLLRNEADLIKLESLEKASSHLSAL